jgi:hypothetical protein
MYFFIMARERERERERERYFVDKKIQARIANHHHSDRMGSLHASVQIKSSCLEILEV